MPNQIKLERAKREANAWWDRLGQTSITTQELREFRDWMEDPVNDDAYEEIQRNKPQTHGRYAVLPSFGGFAVIDRTSGEPAIFAKAPMIDLEIDDANKVAEILSLREFRAKRPKRSQRD